MLITVDKALQKIRDSSTCRRISESRFRAKFTAKGKRGNLSGQFVEVL